jgi:hypothetical protein
VSKTYTETQVMKKLLKILDKYKNEIPTTKQIFKECKDTILADKVYLMLVNEMLRLHLHETGIIKEK